MINRLLQIVAPHYCYSCAKIGTLLCENCKYDIVNETGSECLVCKAPSGSGICERCRTSYDRAWCIGDRVDILKLLLDDYKFERVVDGAEVFASLLDMRLPVLPEGVVVVPMPTIASHIRRRGYDHTLLIARKFAKKRQLPMDRLLRRKTSSVQLGSAKAVRFRQAEDAFTAARPAPINTTYLIVDDIVTTNASVRFAAQTLLNAGAASVWVAVIARQPLDKPS